MVGKTINHYKVLEKIGEGGMGQVYRAEDTKLGRNVAVKFLPDKLTQNREALERFQTEARAASALDHPNICTICDIGEHAGQPFIVMQYLEGQTLKDHITAAPIETGELLELGVQIADALNAAHAQGIIHCDIAAVYAGLGEMDKAFEWLGRTLEPDELDDFWLHWFDFEFAPVRDDPRFQNLMQRMNLQP
jgi:serine/threonine protein kinase